MWVVIAFCFLQSHSALFRSKNKKDEQIPGMKGNVEICPSSLSSHAFLVGSFPQVGGPQQSSPLLVYITLTAHVDCFPPRPSCLDRGGSSQMTWLCWAASTQDLSALWKAMHACVPSCWGRPAWFKSQCKTRLSYGRQKWGCQNMLVLLWAPAYLVNSPFPLKSRTDLGLYKGNWKLQMLVCFVLNKAAFFPWCFWVVATRGKRRWGGGTLFLK